MASITLLLAATLLGGMVFFSFGFAPVLFKQLPMEQVRPLFSCIFLCAEVSEALQDPDKAHTDLCKRRVCQAPFI